MEEKYFVIAIGGTGMRCLEAFIHTCAMGMYDDKEITILALDTDQENGNFLRVIELIKNYNNIKDLNDQRRISRKDTVFSAKLNFFKYSPDYHDPNKNGRFTSLFDYSKQDDRDIANLLLSKNVREFDLKHGYRAQTHLGSLLMYHSMLADIRRFHDGDLSRFIKLIFDATNTSKPKVFVFGSVFGGTGASSIPVIPKAFEAGIDILDPGKSIKNVLFGAILLTSYFKFPTPDPMQRTQEKIVATHNNFSINSQAAMMFYDRDETVKSTYRKFYVIGTESLDYETQQDGNKPVTGGKDQENDCHFIELIAAFAAYDFFKTSVDNLREETDKYYFRAINSNGKLELNDFVDISEQEKLATRFAALVIMSFLANHPKVEFFSQAKAGGIENFQGYTDIDLQQINALMDYMKLFHYSVDENKNIKDGWLRQVHRSAGSSDKFLFHPELFGISKYKELEKFDWGRYLYCEDNEYSKCTYYKTLGKGPFEKFKSGFLGESDPKEYANKMEMLLKRSFDTILKMYQLPGKKA
jgi:hypothetical protein